MDRRLVSFDFVSVLPLDMLQSSCHPHTHTQYFTLYMYYSHLSHTLVQRNGVTLSKSLHREPSGRPGGVGQLATTEARAQSQGEDTLLHDCGEYMIYIKREQLTNNLLRVCVHLRKFVLSTSSLSSISSL